MESGLCPEVWSYTNECILEVCLFWFSQILQVIRKASNRYRLISLIFRDTRFQILVWSTLNPTSPQYLGDTLGSDPQVCFFSYALHFSYLLPIDFNKGIERQNRFYLPRRWRKWRHNIFNCSIEGHSALWRRFQTPKIIILHEVFENYSPS